MKNANFKTIGRQAAKALSALVILTLVGISACKKDASTNTGSTGTVTEADAVELTTDAVIPSTGGFAVQTSTSVDIYSAAKISCGDTKDTTITQSSASGLVPSYAYSLSWNYTFDCTANEFTFNFSGSSNYDGVKMSSTDSSTGSFVLTGILPTATDYTLNTSYERKGSQTYKVGADNSFTSDLKITSSNIVVDKTSEQIVSGSAAVTITGASTSGKTFSFTGTITFLGSKKATLVLNSGTSYAIQWS
jgi:hypothetical protein